MRPNGVEKGEGDKVRPRLCLDAWVSVGFTAVDEQLRMGKGLFQRRRSMLVGAGCQNAGGRRNEGKGEEGKEWLAGQGSRPVWLAG